MTWKTNLQYQYSSTTKHEAVSPFDVTNILDKINTVLKGGITTEIPELSSLLVTKLGGLDHSSLIQV